MARALLLACIIAFASPLSAQGPAGDLVVEARFIDPFWPERDSPRLTTPEWVGDPGVEAVVTISIDDMRDTAKYEQFIRPILEELKKVSAGRAPFSIFTCEVMPNDPQLQSWLKEGVSFEVHTLKHPCPLLQKGDFAAARDTVHGCIDLLSEIPEGKPVCFRMPCCDSMSSPSPRFYAEIFRKSSPGGRTLNLDSSVACIFTSKDALVPKALTTDSQGRERFRKYYHPQPAHAVKSMQNFGTYIEDYPYPYLIGPGQWELPVTMPSDWLAQNFHGKNNPETLRDWEAALEIVVRKKGVMNLCIHPHGWIQAEQVAAFVRHAHETYGERVRFLSFREVADRLAKVPAEWPPAHLRNPLPAPLPEGIRFTDSQGRDQGVRLVDLNGDGHDDLVFSNAERYGVYLFNPTEKKNVDWRVGWTFVMREGRAGDENSLPQIVRADGTNNGVWFKHGAMWVQNEDTATLPGVVRRIPYSQLLKQPAPPSLTPEQSLQALRVKPGFVAELVAAEPMLQDPIFVDWDESGRMWVVEMADYPLGMDGRGKPGGRIKILEDTNRNGVYDKVSLFLDGLEHPTGLAPWKGGIFALAGGELFYAKDTDGDGRADVRETWFTGFAKGNSQHLANGLCWGLDGWFYGANGDSGGKVQPARGGESHDLSGRDFRFNPRTREFQLQPGKTQCGRWRDDYGNWFGSNNSSMGWHYFMDERYAARNPRLAIPTLRRVMNTRDDSKRVFPTGTQSRRYNWPDAVNTLTAACNAMPYRDTLFGEAYRHSLFVCEPANNLVHREGLTPQGISFTSSRADDEKDSEFLASSDAWFRPVMARTGPDGCLYVVDMYRLVLEHPEWIPREMQAHLDLRAGEDKGRIYRIRPAALRKKRPYPWQGDDGLTWDPGSSVSLMYHLASSSGWKADTAQRLLVERDAKEAASIASSMIEGAAETPPGFPDVVRARALWTLYTLGELKSSDVLSALRSSQPLTRAHAVRLSESLLGEQEILTQVCKLAEDPDVRVRVQVALSLGESADSRVPVVLRSLARRDEGNRDMLAAILTAVPRHQKELSADTKSWEAAFKSDENRAAAPAPIVLTNASPDRARVVRQYAGVAALAGNPATGHALFTNLCAACHRLKNEGTELGPDLGMVAAKPTAQLVEAILDPNRAVEARYTTQTITTKQGREVMGLVVEETPNSITVRTAVGLETLLRSEITRQSGNTKSLMPEGLETLLTPQHVADILAWIRQK